jgi:pilus assembly protein FimV
MLRLWWKRIGLTAAYVTAVPAFAISLDSITEQSLLGEPLRVVVPVRVQAGERLSGECLKVISLGGGARDDIPEIVWARVGLERIGPTTRLVVTTREAVKEPAMRITLQAGCEVSIRREYLMLFDPPVTEASIVDKPTSAAVNTGAALSAVQDAATIISLPPEVLAPPSTVKTSPQDASPRTNERSALASAAAAEGPTRGAAPAGQRNGVSLSSTRSSEPQRGPRASYDSRSATDGRPRLTISRTAPLPEPGKGAPTGTFDAMSKDAQIAAVQEQEVVLRKRVEELTLLVVRMQQERIAALSAEVERLRVEVRNAQAAQRAAEATARVLPLSAVARWNGENWPLVVGVLAIAALTGGMVRWRRLHPRAHHIQHAEPAIMGEPPPEDLDTYVHAPPNVRPMAPRFVESVSPNVQRGAEGKRPDSNEEEFDRDLGEVAELMKNVRR